MPAYAALTLTIGVVFVAVLLSAGRKQALEPRRFALIGLEGALYACLMRLAGGYVVGSLRLVPSAGEGSVFGSVVMALGAGFYEEVAFRVLIFGGGAFVLRRVLGLRGLSAFIVTAVWGVGEALAFSGWHYTGALGDGFEMSSFVFRAVCGLILTAIFAFRRVSPRKRLDPRALRRVGHGLRVADAPSGVCRHVPARERRGGGELPVFTGIRHPRLARLLL